SVSSATTCFSFRFSSSSCFSLLASPLSIPPYFAFQRFPCCRHNSAVVNPASPCFRIAMICSSLCRVPFMAVLLSWVWENSHSRRSSFRGLRQDASVTERATELFLEDLLDAAHHEVDDRLRRINDAVGVGFFRRVSLEETLIDFVEEGLLLGKIGGFLGAALDGAIEAFKVAKEIITVQRSLGQFSDYFFNFGGNHVAAGEIRIIEVFAEDTLGEQMLHQHALDRFLGQVGIDSLLAECVEIFEAADESRIAFLPLVNSLANGGGEFRNALGEITDSFFPLLDVGSFVIEELVDDGN